MIRASAFPRGSSGSWRMDRGTESPRRAAHTPWMWWGNKDLRRLWMGVSGKPRKLWVGTPEGDVLSEAQNRSAAAPGTRAQLPSGLCMRPDLGGSSAKTRSLSALPRPGLLALCACDHRPHGS